VGMGRWIPVEAFDNAGHAVFVSDEDGRVEYCNPAMADLLQRDRQEIEGQRCCEVMRLHSPEGKPLCREECAVQSQVRNGKVQKVRPALLSVNGDPPCAVDLFSIAVSPPARQRIAILHVVKISEPAHSEKVVETVSRHEPTSYACLSPREKEVLGHLTSGKGTDQIADELFLSSATVRNHIRAILSKLKVHSRIEAVLASVARR
jgi:DNA-binding CsgD family transcriptional regulator